MVLQEMSHGPITAPGSFFSCVRRLCGQIRENGAVPILYAADGVHPNELGSRIAAQTLAAVIQKHKEKQL